jgi:hypothetical protein
MMRVQKSDRGGLANVVATGLFPVRPGAVFTPYGDGPQGRGYIGHSFI